MIRIKVVCTDQGRHIEGLLGELIDDSDDRLTTEDADSLKKIFRKVKPDDADQMDEAVDRALRMPSGIKYFRWDARESNDGERMVLTVNTGTAARVNRGGKRTFFVRCPRCHPSQDQGRRVSDGYVSHLVGGLFAAGETKTDISYWPC